MLEDIKLLVYVVEYGGFTQASKKLKLHAATISKRMTGFEEQIGLKLFTYDGNTLQPTEYAKRIYEQAKDNIITLDTELDNIINNNKAVRGEVTVMIPPSLSMGMFAYKLPEFMEKYPQIILNIYHAALDVSYSEIQYDLAISAFLPQKESLLVRTILTGHIGFFASEKYIETHGMPATLDDLLNHKIGVIARRPNESSQNQSKYVAYRLSDNAKIEYSLNKPFISSQSYADLYSLVTANMCISTLSYDITIHNVRVLQDKIIHVLPEYVVDYVTVYLIRPNVYKSKVLMLVEDFILECISELKQN